MPSSPHVCWALCQGESYDPKLCAFAAIFASSFYYNIMQVINMNNIKFLS